MRERLRTDAIWWVAALAGVVTMSWLALQGFAWNDYDAEASPAFQALIAGDIDGFLALSPVYGGSMILRAPFAAATAALGGGEVAVYRAVSIPCVLAVAMLGIALVRRMGARGRTTAARALVLGLCVANPISLSALEMGHPEELLCAALAIGAVIVASDGRTILAGVLLGLAIASKAWAVLAIGPVLVALPARRMLALGIAGGVTLAVLAPLLFTGSPQAFVQGTSTTGPIFRPQNFFWFLGDAGHVVIGGNGLPKPEGYRVPPEWLSTLTHPLIASLVVPLSLGWAWVHRGLQGHREHALLLLALLLLLRCALDPWNVIYYELPFLLALLAWEALRCADRAPIATLVATILTWATFKITPESLSPDMQGAFFFAWALPLGIWLARAAFAPTATPAASAGAATERGPAIVALPQP